MSEYIVVVEGPIVVEADDREGAARAAIWERGLGLQIWELGETFEARRVTVHTIRFVEQRPTVEDVARPRVPVESFVPVQPESIDDEVTAWSANQDLPLPLVEHEHGLRLVGDAASLVFHLLRYHGATAYRPSEDAELRLWTDDAASSVSAYSADRLIELHELAHPND